MMIKREKWNGNRKKQQWFAYERLRLDVRAGRGRCEY